MKQDVCVKIIEIFICLNDLLTPLCIGYNRIVQMYSMASLSKIFNTACCITSAKFDGRHDL